MTNDPDFIDVIIDDMEDTHGAIDFFSTTRAAVRSAIERGIRETRPDHPQDGCEDCGHQSDCATHNMPAEKPGHCTCNPFLPDGTINLAAIPPTYRTGEPTVVSPGRRRRLTLDLDTGDWVSGGPLTEGDGYRAASSVLPGMPSEAIERAYAAYMNSDKPLSVPMTERLRREFTKRMEDER